MALVSAELEHERRMVRDKRFGIEPPELAEEKRRERARRFGTLTDDEKKAERAKRFESTQKGDTEMVETTKDVAAQEVTESHNEVHESVAEEKGGGDAPTASQRCSTWRFSNWWTGRRWFRSKSRKACRTQSCGTSLVCESIRAEGSRTG